MAVGTAIGYWLRQWVDKSNKNHTQLTVWPLAVFLLSAISEHYFAGKYDYVKVTTEVYLPFNPGRTYDYIKSVDTVNTRKPFLLNLGLPVPEKCVLEKDSVGALRTCWFDGGYIQERVTAARSGSLLKMDVTKCTVPLPQWLKFSEAIYQFKPEGNGTLLTRVTTYRTELKPRFYWRYFEVKAIEAEHDYVLDDLKERLARRGGL